MNESRQPLSKAGSDSAPLRWDHDLVSERWDAMTHDEREALLRFGHRKAPWEETPDTALRILKCDEKVTLEGARCIDAIFRAAYRELAA